MKRLAIGLSDFKHLIGANSSSQMLVGNGAVSQVASKVGQVQNNRLPLST